MRSGWDRARGPGARSRRGPLPLRVALLAAALLALGTTSASAALAWLPAAKVPESGTAFREPGAAMDANGDSVAVWRARIDGEYRAEASSRPAGGSWSAPVVLSPVGLEAYGPAVVVAPSGEATVGWSTDGAEQVAQVATMSPDGHWSGPVSLTGPTVTADEPSLAVDSSGDVTAAWEQYAAANYTIAVSSRSGAGGGWSGPVRVSTLGVHAEEPSVAVDDVGDVVVTWNVSEELAQAAMRIAGGPWTSPIDLSEKGAKLEEPKAAIGPGGEAVAIWNRSNGVYYVAQAATMSPGGAWAKAVNLAGGTYASFEPSVAIAASGEATVLWEKFSGATASVEATTRRPGAVWSEPAPVTTPGEESVAPRLAVDPAGTAVATWLKEEGTKDVPVAAVRPPGGPWGAGRRLSGSDASDAAVVAADAHGDAVAVWGDEPGGEVEAAGYDGAGPQLRSVSVPGTGTAGVPLSFSVAPVDVWSTVGPPSWSFGDGGSASGDGVGHGYAGAGSFTVGVTATDALGNSSTASGKVAVAPAPAPVPGIAHARRVALVKGGHALLGLACGGGECTGTAKLYAPPVRWTKRHRKRPVLAGSGAFRIAAAASAVDRVKLRGSAAARLRRSPNGRLVVTLRGPGLQTGKVTLREVRHKGGRRHR